ncbi:YugN family protein [Lysinibacillus sp. KU-BSD001]|uniref:YugN family protein n=1 Tax=Lysinibacillus sp. KU-BSD001 TaxID=3141328 RepID=UPI0036ECD7D1
MYFENTKIENIVVDQDFLTNILKNHGLECYGEWDYDRMTFDRRFDIREGRFYLRVFCEAISGDVGAHDATLKILKPALGKYYYPHGVEYNDETFPAHLVKDCEQIFTAVAKDLAQYGFEAK